MDLTLKPHPAQNRFYRLRTIGTIAESTNPSRIDRSLQLTRDEQEKTIKYLDGDIYLMDKIRRYVLLRLDAELSTGGNYSKSAVTGRIHRLILR